MTSIVLKKTVSVTMEIQKELISMCAIEYFGCCISYDECKKWVKGLLEVIENGERIKECLE